MISSGNPYTSALRPGRTTKTTVVLYVGKQLFDKAPYKESPGFAQSLLAHLTIRSDSNHHHHSGHTGEQNSAFRESCFTRGTGDERQQPFSIGI